MSKSNASSILLTVKLMVFLDMFSVALVIPLLSSYFIDANVDAKLWGFTSSTYQLAQLIGGVVFGAMADSLSKRDILLVSFTGSAFSYLLLGSSSSGIILLGSRVIVGLVKQTMTVSTATITEISSDVDARTRHLGHISAAMRFSFVVGPGIGALLYKKAKILPCIAAAVIFALNAIVCYMFIPTHLDTNANKVVSNEDDKNNKQNAIARVWSQLLSLPTQGLRILLLKLLYAFIENAISSRHILKYMENRYGIETYQLGFLQSFTAAVTIFTNIFMIPILLEISNKFLSSTFHLITILCILLSLANVMEALSPSYEVFLFISLVPGIVIGELLSSSLQSVFLTHMPQKDTGKALGVLSVGSAVVGVAAPLYATLINSNPITFDVSESSLISRLVTYWCTMCTALSERVPILNIPMSVTLQDVLPNGIWTISRPWVGAFHLLLVAYAASKTELLKSRFEIWKQKLALEKEIDISKQTKKIN
jgi:MFS transporter, DHA1 family, tetracycline resistance protein